MVLPINHILVSALALLEVAFQVAQSLACFLTSEGWLLVALLLRKLHLLKLTILLAIFYVIESVHVLTQYALIVIDGLKAHGRDVWILIVHVVQWT